MTKPKQKRVRMPGHLPRHEPWRATSVFDAILIYGNDDHFEPEYKNWFEPTQEAPGTWAKVEVLRWRAEHGFPLWHPHDRTDFVGLSFGIQPVEEENDNDD